MLETLTSFVEGKLVSSGSAEVKFQSSSLLVPLTGGMVEGEGVVGGLGEAKLNMDGDGEAVALEAERLAKGSDAA